MKVSGVVITRNEEKNIQRCLESLDFCDEIIVVDSGSNDKTCEIASRFGRVDQTHWRGYVEQKAYAASLASNDWVLSIDADEEVSKPLQEEISNLDNQLNQFAAFDMPRKTFHTGRWIRHGGWYPSRITRLFNRHRGTWVGGAVHERWETEGAVGHLFSDLLHYSFSSISDQVRRNDQYSTLGAVDLRNRGLRFSWSKLITKPLSKFVETYVLKKGALDGYPGFFISISAAYSVFLKWAKLWELESHES